MEDFATALDIADKVLLLPIYPARERAIEGITSTVLAGKMKNADVVEKESIAETVVATKAGVILVVGAGDIGDLVPEIKAQYA
jgi:UDP-N-acetylmuramate--alanine ligase